MTSFNSITPSSAISVSAPSDPTILGCANELLNFIATAASHSQDLNAALFGVDGKCGQSQQLPEPTTLNGILSVACERLALICGELATIKSRLGCC